MTRTFALLAAVALAGMSCGSEEPTAVAGAAARSSIGPGAVLALDRLLAAEDAYSAASLAVEQADWPRAESLLEQAVQLDPTRRAARNLLGLSRYLQHDEEGALEAYDAGLRQHVDDYFLLIGRAFAHLAAGERGAARSDFTAAVRADLAHHTGRHEPWFTWSMRPGPEELAAIEAQCAAEPDDALLRLLRGNAYRFRGQPRDLGRALADYEEAARLDPDFAPAHFVLAVQAQSAEERVAHFERAQKAGLDVALVQAERGATELVLGRVPEGDKAINTALDLDPACGRALELRARLNLLDGARKDAARDFQAAVDCDWSRAEATTVESSLSLDVPALESALAGNPNDPLGWYFLGNVRARAGDLVGAISCNQDAIAADPDFRLAYFGAARFLCEAGEFAEAVRMLDRGLAGAPEFALGHNQRALALWSLGRLAEAEAGFSRAVELAPANVLARRNRGAVRLLTDDLEGGIRDLTAALRLDETSPGLHRERGEGRARLGDAEGARLDYGMAIAIDEKDELAYALRARLALEMGDEGAALPDLLSVLEYAPTGKTYAAARSELERRELVDDCEVCEGTRAVLCTTCAGDRQATCEACQGSGRKGSSQEVCEGCAGAGAHPCQPCAGRGHFKCGNCSGAGVKPKR